MKKTAFVCLGRNAEVNNLIYQEINRKGAGEEFFLFFSPGSPDCEPLLRTLFRDAVSASRLGHPLNYYTRLMERFKELVDVEASGGPILAGAIIVMMIRRGEEMYLFYNRGIEIVHWDCDMGTEGTFESLTGVRELALPKSGNQGDLFRVSIEDQFILKNFTVTKGAHTLVFIPSKEFEERYREVFKNSIFFPSFEVPADRGIEIETSRTFPALHWNVSESGMVERGANVPHSVLRRVSIPAAVGVATALVAVYFVFFHSGNEGSLQKGGDPLVLLSAEDGEGDVYLQDNERTGDQGKGAGEGTLRKDSGKGSLPDDVNDRAVSLKESWKKKFDSPVTTSPVIYSNMVYFGCRDGFMYAFTSDGKLKWRYNSGRGIGASPFCTNDRVIGANYAGDVFCLDIATGKKLWSFPAKKKIVSTPQVRDDLVIVGTMEGLLVALDLKDGRRLWSERIGRAIWANTVIGDDYIIAATTDGSIVKLTPGGKVEWRTTPGGSILSSPLCIDERNLVIFGTKDKYLYAYSLSDGSLMWRYITGGSVSGQPVFDGRSVFVGSEDENLYALTVNGQLLWKRDLGGSILSRPLVIENTVFVTTYSSKLVAVGADSGEVVFEYKAASPVYSSPAHDGERIYFGSNGGIFYVLWLYGETS